MVVPAGGSFIFETGHLQKRSIEKRPGVEKNTALGVLSMQLLMPYICAVDLQPVNNCYPLQTNS